MERETISKASICPNCGGRLRFDIMSGKTACDMCGTYFRPGSIDIIRGFKEKEEADKAESRTNTKQEIVCDSCGATLIADEHTSAAFCAFCGSASLVAGRLRNEFLPDYIIPFKIDREEAKEIFYKWVADYPYAPRDFTSSRNVKKLIGLYVPFWLINATCISAIGGVGYKYDAVNEAQSSNRMVYAIDREIAFGVKNVPFDASKRINDRLMESIEPFDYKEMKEYADAYLPGFYSERYDTNALEMSDRILDRLSGYSKEAAQMVIAGYQDSRLHCEKAEATDLTQNYALFPVWFLNYQYNGINYSFAINGQTGKASGNIPESNFRKKWRKIRRRLPLVLGLTATVGLLLFCLFYLAPRYELVMHLVLASMFVTYCSFPVVRAIRAQSPNQKKNFFDALDERKQSKGKDLQSIEDAPGVEQYYDSLHKADITGEDKFVMLQRKIYTSEYGGKGNSYRWE